MTEPSSPCSPKLIARAGGQLTLEAFEIFFQLFSYARDQFFVGSLNPIVDALWFVQGRGQLRNETRINLE